MGHVINEVAIALQNRALQHIAAADLLHGAALIMVGLDRHLQAAVIGRNTHLASGAITRDRTASDQDLARLHQIGGRQAVLTDIDPDVVIGRIAIARGAYGL